MNLFVPNDKCQFEIGIRRRKKKDNSFDIGSRRTHATSLNILSKILK